MAINISRYVDITSGVGGGQQVSRRDLIGRLFSANNLIPPATTLEFTTAAQVSDYFGSSSEEYLRAAFYFSWISKNITRPQKIQYARWVDAAVAPRVYGDPDNTEATLATWQAVTSGSFGMTINGVVETFSGLNFSGAASLSDVANIVETAVQTGTGTMYTSATVTYSAGKGGNMTFNFVGGDAVDATISLQVAGGGTDILPLLGWSQSGAIIAEGSAIETVTDMLEASANANNDFGSFLFIPALSVAEITEAATWNDGKNVQYLYTIPVEDANVSAYNTAIGTIGGCCLTLSENAGEYPEMIPMMIEAATNYNASNSVQNYMFQQFSGITAGVTTDTSADSYDAARVNYYGQTQEAGSNISFYQRGLMKGESTDPLDMNTYVNELWLKDAATVELMNLFLALPKISANNRGRGQILNSLQSVIDDAVNNGTISVGKTLTPTQKLYVEELTNDSTAYLQIQSIGYWVDVEMVLVGSEYEAQYTLVYSKDDVIRKVTGSHVLI